MMAMLVLVGAALTALVGFFQEWPTEAMYMIGAVAGAAFWEKLTQDKNDGGKRV